MDFDEGYYDGYEKGKQDSKNDKQFERLFFSFLKLLLLLLFLGFIFSGSILTAYFILKYTAFYKYLAGWERIISVLGLAYFLICVVFFLKGIMIVLKSAGKKRWIAIWLLCFSYVCFLPALVVYFGLEMLIGPLSFPAKEGISHYKFWSLTGAIIAGVVIYTRYGLTNDSSLKITLWSYKLGISTGKKLF